MEELTEDRAFRCSLTETSFRVQSNALSHLDFFSCVSKHKWTSLAVYSQDHARAIVRSSKLSWRWDSPRKRRKRYSRAVAACFTRQESLCKFLPLQSCRNRCRLYVSTQFCFPGGFAILPEGEERYNSRYNFVLTDDQGKELYGSCFRFYDRVEGPNIKWETAYYMQSLPEFPSPRIDRRQFMTMDSPKPMPLIEESFEYVSKHPSIPQNTKPDLSRLICSGFATMVPRCIVLITSEPFLEKMKSLIEALYYAMKNAPLFPFECYVMHLLLDIPAPCSQVELKFDLGGVNFALTIPPCNKLPLADINFGALFESLDLNNVLKVFRAILLERNVIFLSEKEEKLTDCAMAILSLLYPFKWRLIFVPLLPSEWIDYMSSPVSFVMGALVTSEEDVLTRCMGEELLVYLDTNTVKTACTVNLFQQTSDLPELPSHYGSKLLKELTNILISECGCKLRPAKLREPRLKPETAMRVRDSFWKFFASVLKDYKEFLNYESAQEDPTSLFNKTGFLEKFGDSSGRSFMGKLMETQMFANFCEARIRTISMEQHYENLLFDEHIARKRNRSKLRSKVKTPFIDDQTKESKTVFQVSTIEVAFSLAPEPQSYAKFPSFDFRLADKIGVPKASLPAIIRLPEEASPPPNAPLRFFEPPRRQGIVCVFLAWLQIWARTLRCQHQSELKLRLIDLISVFETMQKRNCRPTQGDYKVVLDACLKVDSSLALPIFTFMSRNNVMVDAETLSILHKSVSRLSRCALALVTAVEAPPRVFTRTKDTRVFAKKEVRFFVREHCMQCGEEFLVNDIMRLWQNDSDVEIECRACRRAFTPDVQVRVGLEIGSAATGLGRTSTVEGVALYSPFQLRAKTDSLSPVDDLMTLRTYENALFWNLIWYFNFFSLPYEFLLPYEPRPIEPQYRVIITDESPRTAVEKFAPESSHFSEMVRSLRQEQETQTTISLLDPL